MAVDELTAADIPWSHSVQPDLSASLPAPPPTFPENWRLIDDVEAQSQPKPAWIVEGVLQKDSRACIYAPANAGKTTLLAGLLVAITNGKAWFGNAITTSGACLYVPSEDASGWYARLLAAKRTRGLPLDQPCGVYTFPESLSIMDVTAVSQLVQFIRHQSAQFVVIVFDTLSGLMPGANENAIEDMGVALHHAKLLVRELGATVILSHHTNASGNRERGHTVIRGECDTMIALEPVGDVVKVENNKQRNGPWFPVFETRVMPYGESVVMRLAKDVVVPKGELSEGQRRILLVLRDTFTSGGATKAEWQRAATATGVSESSFWRWSKELQEIGFAQQVGTGKDFRISTEGLNALNAIVAHD